MTEGIIQQVFREYISNLNNIPWDKKDLLDLQQKLIERIRKESNDRNSDLYYDEESLKALIGNEL